MMKWTKTMCTMFGGIGMMLILLSVTACGSQQRDPAMATDVPSEAVSASYEAASTNDVAIEDVDSQDDLAEPSVSYIYNYDLALEVTKIEKQCGEPEFGRTWREIVQDPDGVLCTPTRVNDEQYCGVIHFVNEANEPVLEDFWFFFEPGYTYTIASPKIDGMHTFYAGIEVMLPFEETMAYDTEEVQYLEDLPEQYAFQDVSKFCDGVQPDSYPCRKFNPDFRTGKYQPEKPPLNDHF